MISVKPLVSVIIPCFNSQLTIIETLDSVYNQTYKNVEIIIVDDGSTDGTVAVLQDYLKNGLEAKILKQENRGQSNARNNGLKVANGEFVFFIDSDDLIVNTFIEQCISIYEANPSLTLVYCNMEKFDRETGILKLEKFDIYSFLVQNCIPVFAMVRTSQIRKIGGFDEKLDFGEDWECWMHMMRIFNTEIFRIEEPLYKYRKRFNSDSMMDQNKNNGGDEVLLYLFNKHYELYKRYGFMISNLVRDRNQLRQIKLEYYNVWYRKLIYTMFKPNKYRQIMNRLRF